MFTAPEHGKVLWSPFPRQERFLEIPDDIFEALYGGAAGGGKSELLLWLPIARRFHEHPRFHGIIFRKNFPDLEESLIMRSYNIYEPVGGKYNEQKHLWRFPNGARLRFSYIEKDSDVRDHDTAEYNYLAFDELTQFTEFQYRYMTSRVRSSSDLPAIVRAASNPGNIGHSWVRDRFVSPARQGGKLIKDKRTKTKRIFIPAKLTDNPALLKNDPEYINRLQILPEAERKAKIEGDWYTFSGQVFSEFRTARFLDEPEYALHVVEPFKIPEWWPKVVGIDWGFTAKTWVGVVAIAPDGKMFLYKEYVCTKKQIKIWGADVQRMLQFEENIVESVLDPSAWRNLGEEQSLAEQIIAATGLPLNEADNDRVGGKAVFHEMLRWTERPPRYVPKEGYEADVYQRILRNYGMEAARKYERMFEPDAPETNLPKLQIFNTCPEIIKTIPLCIYDEAKPEDVKAFDGDDPYDGCRYLLKACEKYVDQSSKEFNERKAKAKIMDDFDKSHNVTAFYRQMELLESKSRTNVIGFNKRDRNRRNVRSA